MAKWDLFSLTNRIAQAGAVSLHRETTRVAAIDLVKGWLAQEIDVEATILPTVERVLTDTEETSIGSLAFYASAVLKAHQAKKRADRAGAGKPKATDIPDPIFTFDDEDSRFAEFRRDLFGALGKASYARFAHNARFSMQEKGNGDPVVQVADVGPLKHISSMRLMDGERIRIVRQVASNNGFPDVW